MKFYPKTLGLTKDDIRELFSASGVEVDHISDTIAQYTVDRLHELREECVDCREEDFVQERKQLLTQIAVDKLEIL